MQTPPSPNGHFLLGHIPEFKRDALKTLSQGRKQLGDLVRFRLLFKTIYLMSHPEMAERVLIKDLATFIKVSEKTPNRGLGLVLGTGLPVAVGEAWKRRRQALQPMFSRSRIMETAAQQITGAGERLLQRWESVCQQGQTIEIGQEMMQVTADAITRAIFSSDIRAQFEDMGPMFTILLRYAFRNLTDPLALPPSWPTPRNRAFQQARKRLDDMMYPLIEGRQERLGEYGDLLDMLLLARDPEGQPLSQHALRDELITMFTAGHETTATALTWTWYALQQNPHAMERLRSELKTVLNGRTPTIHDLPQLPYTRMVFEESMRLYPPVPYIPRLIKQGTQMAGYTLAEGATAFVSIHDIHRHPDFWSDPDTFNPDRFAPGDNQQSRHRCAYMPFGAGPRVCIGVHFAMTEGQLLLAQIAQRFEVRLEPGHPVEAEAAITLRPRYGMRATLHARD